MKRWKERFKSNCPFCLHEDEDTHHILTCHHADASHRWNESLKQWEISMAKIDTCKHVMIAIKRELAAWRHESSHPDISLLPRRLQCAIHEQRNIGWKQFLEGLLSRHWKLYMTTYYLGKRSKRKGSTWASRLVQYNWKLIASVWESRNEQLHQTERIHDLEGMSVVRDAIKKEWDIGLGRLPASQFSHYFNIPMEKLLLKSHEYLKSWLMTIRQGRILLDPENLLHDEIETSDTLQKWLDISYKVTDDEGKPPLVDAITAEWNLGSGCLPRKYDSYFSGSLKQLHKKDIQYLKRWLRTVRGGRIKYDSSNLLLDEFSSPGALRQWLTQ